jgi:hypothetical protein
MEDFSSSSFTPRKRSKGIVFYGDRESELKQSPHLVASSVKSHPGSSRKLSDVEQAAAAVDGSLAAADMIGSRSLLDEMSTAAAELDETAPPAARRSRKRPSTKLSAASLASEIDEEPGGKAAKQSAKKRNEGSEEPIQAQGRRSRRLSGKTKTV